MKIFETISSFTEWRKSIDQKSTIGFVPTMGALHAGHESLLTRARKENDQVVLSIFVNPSQFNQISDFENYPKTWEKDLDRAKRAGVDAVFAPKDSQSMYPDQYHYKLTEAPFSQSLCGEFRLGHFDGMLTIVMKLFQITRPASAYFGEKDYQQLSLVRGMIEAFFLGINLVACPTLREKSGLALSSRNARLNEHELRLAPELYHTLTQIKDLERARENLIQKGFRVEYLVDQPSLQGTRRFVAAWLSDVRLIDNVEL